MSTERKVARHFDADAERFDAIYHSDKGALASWIDRRWRGVVGQRLDLVLERLSPLEGKTVLDVGCGSGRHSLALAAAGADRVVGVDFAPAMIEVANRLADESDLRQRCEFVVGTFPQDLQVESFDASIAMGFFDYVEDPATIIRAMRERTRSTMMMSFPKRREFRVPLRRLRFRVMDCPLFLYSESRVRALLDATDVSEFEWIDLDRDYLVVASR